MHVVDAFHVPYGQRPHFMQLEADSQTITLPSLQLLR
jgi:hypothetical protein